MTGVMSNDLVSELRNDFQPEATCSVTKGRFRPVKHLDQLRLERRQAADHITALEAALRARTTIEEEPFKK